MIMKGGRGDQISPTEIEHLIEEFWIDDVLEQRYNYIDYHFEHARWYFRARVYRHDTREVALFGPFERRGSIAPVVAGEEEALVVAYLSRRYRRIVRI